MNIYLRLVDLSRILLFNTPRRWHYHVETVTLVRPPVTLFYYSLINAYPPVECRGQLFRLLLLSLRTNTLLRYLKILLFSNLPCQLGSL